MELLFVGGSDENRAVLHEIAAACRWKLECVENAKEALALLKVRAIPVVICDRARCGEDWRKALRSIAFLPQPTCVFLASPDSGEAMGKEVLRHHGYDLLAKPFQRAATPRRAMVFPRGAWRSRIHPRQSGIATLYYGFCDSTGTPVVAAFNNYTGGFNVGGGISYALGETGLKCFGDIRYNRFLSHANNEFISLSFGIRF